MADDGRDERVSTVCISNAARDYVPEQPHRVSHRRATTAGGVMSPCPIVELRRYALHPGARETLIELFDREFVEPQEAVGMHILGQFRDLDDADSFVWLRGFDDMRSREQALRAFYSGPVWKQNSRAANATMVDSDNVLLLRPVKGVVLDAEDRRAPSRSGSRPGLLAVTIYPLRERAAHDFLRFFEQQFEPALLRAGISVLATYATEHSANTFPALPVREGEEVFVWLATFADEHHHAAVFAKLEQAPIWTALDSFLDGPVEMLRLTPTVRSLLHG